MHTPFSSTASKGVCNTPLRVKRTLCLAWLITFLCIKSAFATDAADVIGHWDGAFTRFGAAQYVSIDLAMTDSGLVGTYDIPDLILYREPLQEVLVTSDSLIFRLFWGRFPCLVHDDIGEITGVNSDWGPPVSIHLRRAAKIDQYRIEPIQFEGSGMTLHGDLLLPRGHPPFPAVVLIEGSTQQGRGQWTYRSLGDLYARNGIAALVYDKRGVGQSGGDPNTATFADLAEDAAAAVRFLQPRSDIRTEQVGLHGISQGGWLAPLAAAKLGDAAFLILEVGPAVSVWDQELQRVEYSMKAGINGEERPDSFSTDEVNRALRHTRLGFAVAQRPDRWVEWQESVAEARQSRWASYVALDSTNADLQGWMRQRYDPAATLRGTQIPVLAIFGSEDVLVPPDKNAELMRSLLSEAGNTDVTIVTFPGVGHELIQNATLVGGEWDWPSGFWRWTRRAPGLADSLVAWTRRHTEAK